MDLSTELINQFVKITNDKTKTKKETIVYGTTVEHDGVTYVKLDGSELLTPVNSTASVKPNERVTVMIKNHMATITGNMSSPSASTNDLNNVAGNVTDAAKKITEFEIALGTKAEVKELKAESARIDTLVAEDLTIKQNLAAANANIETLRADNVTVTKKLTANEASIEKLQTDKLDAAIADITFATIKSLEATNADINNLEVTYGKFVELSTNKFESIEANIENFNAVYANIDFSNIGKAAMEYFYSQSGLIENVVVGDQTITGNLVGVTISGDLIEGNTVKADKLVIKGSDGLYYKLNTDGMVTEAEQTDQNSLNGSIIKAKSIAATKISVSDLVAFDATIGGFNITENSIYSGVKESVGNTTRGIYLDNTGQVAFGDSNNYIKYYKDTDGSYKLAISADSILMSSGTNVAVAINNAQNAANAAQSSVDKLQIGGRNLLRNTKNPTDGSYWSRDDIVPDDELGENVFYITMSTAGERTTSSNRIKVVPGETYTISLYAKRTENVRNFEIFFLSREEGSTEDYTHIQNKGGLCPTADVWTKYTWTFTMHSEAYEGYVRIDHNGSTDDAESMLYYTMIKMETGNKATDWTPAPEDMATNAGLNTVADRVADAEAQIIVNKEGITQVASRTSENETNITTLSLTADGLTTRLNELSVGGTNMLKYSNDDPRGSASNPSLVTNAYSGFNAAYYDNSSGTGFVDISSFTSCVTPLPDTEYTLSFYAKGSGNIHSYFYPLATATGTSNIGQSTTMGDGNIQHALTSDWKKYIITWKTLGDVTGGKSVLPMRAEPGAICYICGVKFEKGNVATDWSPSPAEVDNAAKTATNYLNFSASGLVVGDHTADTLKKNVLIDSDSVDIRDGEDVLASFGANKIVLGQNAEGSTINLCDGAGSITALVSESADSTPRFDSIQLESQKLVMRGKRIYNTTAGSSAAHENTADMEAISYVDSAGAVAALKATTTLTTSEDVTTAGVQALTDADSAATRTRVYAEFEDASSGTATSNSVYVYPTITEFTKPISINGHVITGTNKVLWAGASQMIASHTATLNQAISEQPNGIVLVFSEYIDGEVSNTAFHHRFIPKHQVANHGGSGCCVQLSSSNLAYFGTKYLYINDTTITGNDNNTLTGASNCGIARTCNRFCLRYVIGV